ncbi:MAG: hypothetical protein PHQ14_03915 [Chromatiales bacterium]|nr:hypothetical protein [Chromatiales bacterium]
MPENATAADARLILYHKQSTSARTRFLRLADSGVCAFEALPPLSSVMDTPAATGVLRHPADLLRAAEERLGLARGGLEIDAGFRAQVDTPDGPVMIHLARFTGIDPPFDAAERIGGRFVALTEVRDLPPAQLELLRRAYACIMEG